MKFLVLDRTPERGEEIASLLRGGAHRAVTARDPQSAAGVIQGGGFDALVLELGPLDISALLRVISPVIPIEPETLEAAECRHLALMLRYTAGNKRKAAHLLGISRSTLLNKVRKYGLAKS